MNPVKVKHRVFDNFGERTRFEYDANVLKELTYSEDKRIHLYPGDATRLLISCDEEAEFSVRVLDYLGVLNASNEIVGFPKDTLLVGAQCMYFENLSELRSFDLSSGGAAQVTTGGTNEKVSTYGFDTLTVDGSHIALYRMYHTKQLLIDIPIFGLNNTSTTSEIVIEIKNLDETNQQYKVYLMEEI